MKKSIKIILIIILTIIIFIINNTYAYTNEEYNQKVEESIAYVLSQIDNNMSEYEKANILADYAQTGNLYAFGPNNQKIKGVLVDHEAVCAGYADTYRILMNRAGLPCEEVRSAKAKHGWNINYIDGIWSYTDTTKGMGSYQETSPRKFLSQKDFDFGISGSSYYFTDAIVKTNGIGLPETETYTGKTESEVAISSIYYDEEYKYYINRYFVKASPKDYHAGDLCKESRKTGKVTVLVKNVLLQYDGNSTNIAKDGDYIYYVDVNKKSIHKINKNGSNDQKVLTLTDGAEIAGVFPQDGYIRYTKYPDPTNNPRKYEKVDLKPLENYLTTGEYNVEGRYILKYIKTNKGVTITRCEGINGNEAVGQIIIPSYIESKPIVGIGDDAFYNSKLTGIITLPESLEYIGDEAFRNSNITGIQFGGKLKSIGQYAFSECKGINTNINLPDSLTYAGRGTFTNCNNITGIKFGKNLKVISSDMFSNCINLQEVLEIPEGVTMIANGAFSYCTSIKGVVLPETLEYAYNPFGRYSGVEDVWIKSSNMKYIQFVGKENVYLPEGTATSEWAKKHLITYKDSRNLSFASAKMVINNTKTNEKDIVDLNLELDAQTKLSCNISPRFWQINTITWTSENSSIAQIDSDGNVVAIGDGRTNIRATLNGKSKSIECISKNLNTIKLNKNDVTIIKNNSENIRITNSNNNITWKVRNKANPDIEYNITDSEVSKYLKIENTSNRNEIKITAIDGKEPERGKRKDIKEDQYSIIAYDENGYKGICNVTVVVPVEYVLIGSNSTGISINATSYYGDKKMTLDYQNTATNNFKLKMNVEPSNATIMGTEEWIVADENTIQYNGNGEFTVLKGGKTIITLKLGEKTNNIDVTITGDVPIDSFTLDKQNIQIKKNHTSKLTTTISPSNTTRDKTVTWTSSNNAVATVDNDGIVTAKSNGTAVITATCDTYTQSCNVEVRNAFLVNEIKKLNKAYILNIEPTKAKLDDNTNVQVNWKTNNERVSVSNDGLQYTPLEAGFATLTGYSEEYGEVTHLVFVNERITLSDGSEKYAGDLNGNYEFDEEDILILKDIIDNDKINADYIRIGDVNGDKILNNVDIALLTDIVKNKRIQLDAKPKTTIDIVGVENSVISGILVKSNFIIEHYPEDATDYEVVKWESSNPDVAIVDEKGNIQRKSVGATTITATIQNGNKSTFYLRVTEEELALIPKKEVPITGITLSANRITIKKGESYTLIATITPTDTTESKDITWTSTNMNVTVDNTGKVTGMAKGTAIVKATASNGKETMCVVYVEEVKEEPDVPVNPNPSTPETPDVPIPPVEPEPQKPVNPSNPNYQVVSKPFPFIDVKKSDWYYNSVKFVYDRDIILGTTSTTFKPKNNLTRGMLVTILWRMEGSPTENGGRNFPDVKSSEYYYEAVKWAASKGVVNGYDDGKFRPNNYITRQQLAVMIYNYAKYKGRTGKEPVSISNYKDYKKVNSYATEAVKWAIANKIISGKENGTKIEPQGNATRAEASAMIQNYLSYVK